MVDARDHAPKLAALAEYRRGRLSTPARTRLERHLAVCPTCQRALLGLTRFERLSDDALAVATPEIDWARMELPLRREIVRLERARRLRLFGGLLGVAAAAAAVALVVGPWLRPAAHAPRAELAAPQPNTPAPIALRAQVTALMGAVDAVDEMGRRVALEIGSVPSEGWTLETGSQSELHMALEGTAALILAPGSRLTLQTLREHEVELNLVQGQVISHVEKRFGTDRYEVRAGVHRVAVRGTRFAVERTAANRVGVQVDEGVVALFGTNDELLAELRAPIRWPQAEDTVLQALRKPLEAAAQTVSTAVLELPTWSHIVGWDVAGGQLGAAAELQMRAPAGDLEIAALLDDGRRVTARMHLDALGGRFDPRTLRVIGARVPGIVRGTLDPESISRVIRESQVALQRCYERALRDQQSALSGAVRARLRLELSPRGKVERIEWLASKGAAETPTLLKDCVRRVAQGWQFPPPGGSGVAFEAPISFSQAAAR